MKIYHWSTIVLVAWFGLIGAVAAADARVDQSANESTDARVDQSTDARGDESTTDTAPETTVDDTAENAGETASERELTKEERLEIILTEALPESEYRETSRCIQLSGYSDVEVVSDRYIFFSGRKGYIWINRLDHRCRGLRRDQILKIWRFGRRLCATDQVAGMSRFDGIETGRCRLGEFEKIEEERAEMLKEAIRQANKS